MNWLLMVLLMLMSIMMVIMYALLVAASDADDAMEEAVREWIETHGELVDGLKVDTISADKIRVEEQDDELVE